MDTHNRFRLILFFLVGALVINLFPSVIASHTDSTLFWHAYKGDTSHTGFYDQSSDRKLALHWRYFFRGDYANPLQVVGDKIFFLDRSGFVCCINRTDGSELYRVQVDEKRLILGLDVSHDQVVVSTGPIFSRRGIEEISCVLFAFSIQNGEKLWQKKIDVILITPPIVANGKIWIASGKLDPTFSKTAGGDLICINSLDGEILYQTEVEEYAFYGNYLTMSDGIILSQGLKYDRTSRNQRPPRLFAFSEKTGSLLWEQDPLDETKMFGTPSIKDQFVYVTENPGFFGGSRRNPEAWLLKIDLKTGKIVKTMNIQNETFGNFSPTLSNDAIYINSFTGKIYAIDYQMDRIYWVKEYDRFSYFTELTATRNFLYTCLFNGDVIAVSKADGDVQFRYRIGNYGGIPVVAEDQLLVTGDVLYCFSTKAEPILYTEPSSLQYETVKKGETKQLSFRIIYTGADGITGSIRSSEPWLTIRPDSITSNIQTCFVSLDSDLAPAGVITATVTVETNRGVKTIQIEAEIIVPKPLQLEVNIPLEGLLTNQRIFMILGQTEPLSKVYVNDWMVFANENGRFSHVLTLKEGNNAIRIEAISKDNRKASLERQIQLDSIPPDLQLESVKWVPETNVLTIIGITEPGIVVEMIDEKAEADETGRFTIDLTVEEDITSVEISVVDHAGNKTIRTVHW